MRRPASRASLACPPADADGGRAASHAAAFALRRGPAIARRFPAKIPASTACRPTWRSRSTTFRVRRIALLGDVRQMTQGRQGGEFGALDDLGGPGCSTRARCQCGT